MRLLPLLLLLLGPLPAVAGAGAPEAPERVDFPVFVGGFGIEFFTGAAREYEALRPGVHLDLYGSPRIAEQVRVRVLAGDAPTATDAVLPWDRLIAAGRVLDLAPALEGPDWDGGGRWRDRFAPGVLDAWRQGDAVYAVPFGHAAIVLFFDRALLRKHGWEVPRTWEELFALAPRIEAAGLAPFVLPGRSPTAADYLLRAAYRSAAGAEAYAAWQQLAPGSYDHPALRRSAEAVQRLVRQHTLAGWEGMTHTEAQLQFLQGRAVFLVTGSWLAQEMRGRFPDAFELGAANLPVFADGVGDPADVQTGSGYYFVFADDPQRDHAVDFLRFLTAPERAEAFVRAVDSPAAVRGLPREAFSPAMRDVADLLAGAPATYGRPPGLGPVGPGMLQAEIDARDALLFGRFTPEAYAGALEAAADRARARAAAPLAVEVRHPWRGTLVIGALAAAVLLLAGAAWRGRRRRRAGGAAAPGLSGGGGLRVNRLDLLAFLGPGLAVYLMFLLLPAGRTAGWAFRSWDGFAAPEAAGTSHLRRWLFEHDGFGQALSNNLFLVLVPALGVIPLSLILAVLLRASGRAAALYRTCFLFPNLLGGIAATLLWMYVYNPQSGLLNALLTGLAAPFAFLGLDGIAAWFAGFERFAWLAPDRFYLALVPIYLWLHLGFNLILFLAALDQIDPALPEAAAIDGAGPVSRFFHITLPLVADVIGLAALFLVINGFTTFELIWILTGQQPPAGLHVLGTLLVSTLFQDYDVGAAAALALLQASFMGASALLILRFGRREALA